MELSPEQNPESKTDHFPIKRWTNLQTLNNHRKSFKSTTMQTEYFVSTHSKLFKHLLPTLCNQEKIEYFTKPPSLSKSMFGRRVC